VVIGGITIRPGDAKEEANRKQLADGVLGLDMYGLRAKLGKVEYIAAAEYARRAGEGGS
jgi:hypothetical protein